MASGSQLDLLSAIAERSPEGMGIAEDTLRPLGGPTFDEDLAALLDEGLVAVVAGGSGGSPDTIAITDEGRAVLLPQNPA